MTINASLFSSATDDWATPSDLFDELSRTYQFTLDPCASPGNHKCARYFTKDDDGLAQDWGQERVFMNPPYGRSIGAWMQKAYEASLKGALVVCLVPARVDTAWWAMYAAKGQVRFFRGRIKFGGSPNSAPFPSALVTFYPASLTRLFVG